MSDDIVISAQGLWKRYGFPLVPAVRRTVRNLRHGRLRSLSPEDDGPWALQEIDLEVRRGETLGLIGRNGAGKSTLLKVLAGVTPPTRGRVHVQGRIFPMIELNAGIHAELTGRENVHLLGTIMGVPRSAMKERIPEIEAFCELGEWFDQPVRKYSSGMKVRLGFAVALHVDSEILLVDEMLSAGDAAFQRKCLAQFDHLRTSGATVIYVTHWIRQVERLCSRVMLLDRGKKVFMGRPSDAMAAYFEQINRDVVRQEREDRAMHAAHDAGVENLPLAFTKIALLDANGEESDKIHTNEPLVIQMEYASDHAIEHARIVLTVLTTDNVVITLMCNEGEDEPVHLETSGVIECRIDRVLLMQGAYLLNVKVLDHMGVRVGGTPSMITFQVVTRGEDRHKGGGLFISDVSWRFSS